MNAEESEIHRLVSGVAAALEQRGWILAVAESCTGGWIAKCCTDLAGSSNWFERGFVTYSDRAKRELLGVDGEVLKTHGAVSREVAEQMALGALGHAPVNAALSVTGIAGPDGGSAEKPVGTVWFAWAVGTAAVDSERCRFDGDREAVRRQTVLHALRGLHSRLGGA